MKLSIIRNFLALLFFIVLASQTKLIAQKSKEFIYVGTFSGKENQGVYVLEFDRKNSTLEVIQNVFDRINPSYLEVNPNGKYLYAANRQGINDAFNEGSISVFEIDQKTGKLKLVQTISSFGESPCHISVDPKGQFIAVSHYISAHLSIFRLNPSGDVGELIFNKKFIGNGINENRQLESHIHSAVIDKDGKTLYVSDLGSDRIYQLDIERHRSNIHFIFADTINAKPGSGPRHFALHPKKSFAYSIEELTSSIAAYAIQSNSKNLKFKERVNMLSDQAQINSNLAADIVLNKDGRLLYGSIRGVDSIAPFQIKNQTLTPLDKFNSMGKKPRGLYFDQLGEYLMIANQDSDKLSILEINPISGMPTGKEINGEIGSPAVIRQLFLKGRK